MILKVSANQPSFKTVSFKPGLNIVLAKRTDESRTKDTRNGLGKTTLLNIIHFCLAAHKRSIPALSTPQLDSWVFSLELCISGHCGTVSRSLKSPTAVETDLPFDSLLPQGDSGANYRPKQKCLDIGYAQPTKSIGVHEWESALKAHLYGIGLGSINPNGEHLKLSQLLGYDVRREQFMVPFKSTPHQSAFESQLCNAYVLELDHDFVWALHQLNRTSNAIASRRKELDEAEDLNPSLFGTLGELRTERDRLSRELAEYEAQLRSFQVHPQYTQIQNEADTLTQQIHDQNNRALQLKRLISFHEQSAKYDAPATDTKVIELYEAAGTALDAPIAKRLEEVQAFHAQITRNRRDYLQDEARRLDKELDTVRGQIEELSNQRIVLMRILETHGAIEEYHLLQDRHHSQQTQLDSIERRIEQLIEIDRKDSHVNRERRNLYDGAQRDFEDRQTVRRAYAVFNSNSKALYKAPGNLVVDIDPNKGYAFRVDIKSSRSAGISKMKVFCYDLMRAELWSQRKVRPGFLIHDSDIFADVDERQIARALELAERKSRECGFQYIVCLNSDKIPRQDEFTDGFDFNKFVRLTLTDGSDEGRLLGMGFEP